AQSDACQAEFFSAEPGLVSVQVALSWESMFYRYGDVLVPTVSLAARMEAVARSGTVMVDAESAEAIEAALPGGFSTHGGEDVELHGIGTVHLVEMRRDRSTPLNLGL